MTNSVCRPTALIGWYYGGNFNIGLVEEVLVAIPAVTLAMRPVDAALFAAGEINAVCWRAASLYPGHRPCTARLHGDENCSTQPPCILLIDMSSLSTLLLCALSFCVPNSSPTTHVLTAEATSFRNLRPCSTLLIDVSEEPMVSISKLYQNHGNQLLDRMVPQPRKQWLS
jgi:hypothetical protein